MSNLASPPAEALSDAVESGDLLESSAENIRLLLKSDDPVLHKAVSELVDQEAWQELNDRFFKKLAFGTGGMRSRTIGRIVTDAERGTPQALDRPEFPCVGTNALNYYNLSRATQGLVNYLKESWKAEGKSGRPSLGLAHDTRHFAVDFAEFVAKVATENGCDVHLFTGPRSTPELSFLVRHRSLGAGIVLTASHNPPHDNGYKVYWNDGAQVVEPHASNIIAAFNAVESDAYTPLPEGEQGQVHRVGEEIDAAYMDRLQSALLDPDLVKRTPMEVVFTNLHGTGGKIVPAMLRRLGFNCETVPAQDSEDGRFPTVDSPNPENAPALAMAIEQANKSGADVVIATDPDADRMGVAVRGPDGEMVLLTGNQIGSLIGWYRIETFFEKGVLTEANKANAVLVKTFVTTDLQKAIADKFGIRCVETLTGFKYIGQKLGKYEAQIPKHICEDYRALDDQRSRDLRLEHSSFFVFGGEESYGYLGADFVRDKDANMAAVMFAELAAFARSNGMTLPEVLDRIFQNFGYFTAKLHSLVMEGAEGASQIAKLAESYSHDPPKLVDGSPVARLRNFNTEDHHDIEGDLIPREKMIIIDLEDGRAFAVRPSGTEPKIKYYLFGKKLPPEGDTFTAEELPGIKKEIKGGLDQLWAWLESDIETRLA